MISYGFLGYEKEGDESKLYILENNAIGYAGSSLDISKLHNKMKKVEDFPDCCNKLLENLNLMREEEILRKIQELTRMKVAKRRHPSHDCIFAITYTSIQSILFKYIL